MPARQPGGHLAPADIATVASFLVAGLACCYLLAALLLRTAARHRRRRHPDPRQRVAGAWLEVLGDLRTAGSRPLAPLTAAEVAEHGTALLGPSARPPLARLAGLANAALFAPAAPAAVDADAAWADAAALRRLARRRSSWRSRIAALLFPWRCHSSRRESRRVRRRLP